MPRPPRIDVPGVPQHLVTRGHDRRDCFFRELDRVVYLKYLEEALEQSACDMHAYVLMSNHVHLLVTGRFERSISRLMQFTGRRYCRYVNRAYERTGTLYEGRFKSSLIESEAYLLECMRYIDLNPVRAGIVDRPDRYPWSSYRQNAGGDPRGFLKPHYEYLRLGSDRYTRAAAYSQLVAQPLADEQLERIRNASAKNGVLASDEFKNALQIRLAREVSIVGPGRPRKSAEK